MIVVVHAWVHQITPRADQDPRIIALKGNAPMRSRKRCVQALCASVVCKRCVQAVCALSPRLNRREYSKGVELKDQAAIGIIVTDANPPAPLDYLITHRL